jgi:hypothetical protein
MAQATKKATFTSQTIAVEHIKISSERSFAEVRRRLEDTLATLDVSIAEVLRNGDQKRAKDYDQTGPKLSIFEKRDHGAFCGFLAADAMRCNMRSAIPPPPQR